MRVCARPPARLHRPCVRKISLTSLPSRTRPPPLFSHLKHPIVLAPLAGGPSTPALAAAVSKAGGLGRREICVGMAEALPAFADPLVSREAPFGVNLFVPSATPADAEAVKKYAESLKPEAERLGVPFESLEPRYERDFFEEKIEMLTKDPVKLVSFTFGVPPTNVIQELQHKDTEVWVTVTSPAEAKLAADAGADALIVQGQEAGGHQSTFVDSTTVEHPLFSLLPLLQLIRRTTTLPLVAAGGLMTGESVAAVLCAGAQAAQLGSAFLCAKEAGTSELHRRAIASHKVTGLTRAFSGRIARGVVNQFMTKHSAAAPSAYPEVNNLTRPLRTEALKKGDDECISLWAGQGHQLAESLSAADIVEKLAASARTAADQVHARLHKK